MIANFRGIFADPRAKVCFGAVFLEAIFIQGLFPYVALLLIGIGETRASIAGLLIALFAIGGVGYSLVAAVRDRQGAGALADDGGRRRSCRVSMVMIALHLPWQAQIAVYAVFGLGFYLLHGCIQLHVTDLSQTARGAAASLHSSSFYMGQAIGPVIYGFGIAHGGPEPTLIVGALVVSASGWSAHGCCARRT